MTLLQRLSLIAQLGFGLRDAARGQSGAHQATVIADLNTPPIATPASKQAPWY
jgi:hypothetical protein